MVLSKKTKIASTIDINQLPNIYSVIQRQIKNIDANKVILTSDIYGNIYFVKDYLINLSGWSGLDNFYSNLEKIKKLKKHDDNAIINRVVLDSSLCLRVLTDQQAKQFWKKDYRQQIKTGYPFQISVVVCDYIKGDANGFYSQGDQTIYIAISDVQTMLNTLIHQFVHVLDHITALTLKQNCEKLIQNYGFAPGQGNGIDDSHLFKTPNKDGKNLDLHDIYNTSKQEYSASFAQIVNIIDKTFLDDMRYRHRQFYVQDLSNLMFCYVTGYNILRNKAIDRNLILTKLQALQNNTQKLYYDLFEYIINNNQSDVLVDLDDVRSSNAHYNSIVKDMYNILKGQLSNVNQVQRQLLESI